MPEQTAPGSVHAPGRRAHDVPETNRQAIRTVFTIGHSTRTCAEFVALLREVGVTLLVDVRSIPRSRAMPQFNNDTLPDALAAAGIGYRHLGALGGRRYRRKSAPPSRNTYWRVKAFRDYADYAETSEFRAGLDTLLALAGAHRCAIMCAEAVWWRCHRSLIADALCVRGIDVVHILDATHSTPHPMTQPARIVDGRLSYAAPAQESLL